MKNKKLIFFIIMNIFLVSTICAVYSSQIAQKNQLSNTNQTILMQIAPVVDQTPIDQMPLIAKVIPNQTGWPITLTSTLGFPALVDLDGDGYLEVVIIMGAYIYFINHDGSVYWQSPWIQFNQVATPAIGDIDGDGDLEVVIGALNGNIYAWHGDGSPALTFATGSAIQGSSPALGDLDNDGDLEIVIGTDDSKVWAVNGSGYNVTGWPVQTLLGVYSSPAIGDIDDDGDLEVVLGGADHMLYAWHHDGTNVTGFPQYFTNYYFSRSSPALGDLDGDGDLEIVIGSGDYNVTAWHHNGTLVWDQNTGGFERFDYGSPALGDIDGDGDLEIVVGSYVTMAGYNAHVYAWHHDGTPVVGWPQATGLGANVRNSPVLGDIDGDGDIEILATTRFRVNAWHHNGSLVNDWPFSLPVTTDNGPALGDLDSDGDIEVVATSGYSGGISRLYALDCSGVFDPVNVPWSRFHHDNHGTGLAGYVAELMVCITSPTEGTSFPSENVTVTWSAESPGGIDNYSVQIDNNGTWIPKGTNTNHTFLGLSEGQHIVDVRVFDLSGNNATDTANFSVDLNPPTVNIIDPSDQETILIADVMVNWTGSDTVGIEHYEVMIDNDNTWIDVGTDTNHTFNGLSDGNHSVDIIVFDNAGYNDTDYVNFTVQAPPTVTITSPMDGIVYNSSNLQLNWTGSDNTGIDHYEIRLDTESWIPVGTNVSYALNRLSNGNHSIYVRAFDTSGNNATDYVNFTVNAPKKAEQPFLILLSLLQQEGIPILYIGVIGAVVAVVAVVGVVLFLRRRK